jgi:hypothetical protein
VKLTVVLHPGTDGQTDVVVPGTAATIGSAERAQVRVEGLEPLHAVIDARDGEVVVETVGPGVVLRDEPLLRHVRRTLRRDDVLRIGPTCTLRVDVPFLALAAYPAVMRGLCFVTPPAALMLLFALGAPKAPPLLAISSLFAELAAAIALAALVELHVSRLGPTPARRATAFVGNAALFAGACVAIRVNLEYMTAALTTGPASAGAAAHDAIVGCATSAFAHRALTLGLVMGIVTELRWSRSHTLVTLGVSAVSGVVAAIPAGLLVDALGLPESGGSSPPMTGMVGGGYMVGTLMMAVGLGVVLHVVQRFGPGSERSEPRRKRLPRV